MNLSTNDLILYIFLGLAGLVVLILVISMIKEAIGNKKKEKAEAKALEAKAAQEAAKPQPTTVYYCYGWMPNMAPIPGMPVPPMMQQPSPQPEQKPEPAPMKTEEPKAEAPAPEPVNEEVPAQEEVQDAFAVKFNPADNTLEAKYGQLSKTEKAYYDEIRDYAQAIESSRTFKNSRYEEIKIGVRRLVRLIIKRGHVQAEFVILGKDVIGLLNDSDVAMKVAPMVIKIQSEDDVAAAKKSIDVAHNAILEEKAYKKELSKQKRKQGKENHE